MSTPEQFWARVDTSSASGCWLWMGWRMRNGYGGVGWHGRTTLAHRIAYQLAYGPIPRDRHVCHTCDVRHCMNPAHLWLGTAKENSRDMVRKGRARNGSRTHPERLRHGETHWNAKLTAAQVQDLRARYKPSLRRHLAVEFGIHPVTVNRIVRADRWRMQ